MNSACTPRARWAEREATQLATAQAARDAEDPARAERLAQAERASLADPDRPRVLRPAEWPEKITVRVVYPHLPGAILAETSPDQADQTSMTLTADNPETAMAGAEVALAALGYTLDRFRLYTDDSLMVGTFYHSEGPHDAAH